MAEPGDASACSMVEMDVGLPAKAVGRGAACAGRQQPRRGRLGLVNGTRLLRLGAGLLVLLLAGCGYRLLGVGNGALPANGVRSVAVPVFANLSGEPELEQRLTAAVRREFLNDGRLQVVTSENADTVLEGTISSYQLQALAFDALDNATQYRLRLTLDTTLRSRSTKQIMQRQQFSAVQEYRLPQGISGRETARQRALEVAARQLAQQLVKIILEGF
ncbi:MAG: LptE family protein [Candidatus Tectomicrobia bacterium]|nr:LptE family protein [Candidatus Tectomicrobia bacterium]